MDGNGHPEAVPAGTDVIVMPAQVGDADASEIAAAVLAALIGDIGIVVADFTGTQFCDPAGIQSLLGAARLADANRITLRLVAFGVVAVVFGQAGVDQVLPVYPTLREALTASPPP